MSWRKGLPELEYGLSDDAEKASCLGWIQGQLHRRLFWGYGVDDILRKNFFMKLSLLYGCGGFCRVAAPLVMLALGQSRQTRLVYAEDARHPEKGERVGHMWVELRYNGLWYVIDPTWFKPEFCLIPRPLYYGTVQSTSSQACYLDGITFWKNPTTTLLHENLLKKESSCIFSELMDAYHPRNADILDADSIRSIQEFFGGHYVISSAENEVIVVCQAIVDDIMRTGSVTEDTKREVQPYVVLIAH